MPRQHVHITLPPELYARTRAVVDRLPGASVSGMVEEFFAEVVPYLEATLDAAEKGDVDAVREVLSGFIGDRVVHMLFDEGVSET